jgi:hypothetical protein
MDFNDSIDLIEYWMRTLHVGVKIQSPTFPGDTWVKGDHGWSRGRREVSTPILLSFSLRWTVVP